MSKKFNASALKRFWKLLSPHKAEIRNVYIYSIFIGLINLSLPLGIQAIINIIQGGQVSTSWYILILFVVSGVGFSGVMQIFQINITENLQRKVFTRAAFELAYRIPKIKFEATYKHYAPELMNRFFDIIIVQKGLSKILIEFSAAILQVTFGLILLSFYHPFFIAFSLVLILLVYVIFRFTSSLGLSTSLQESKHKYETAHWLQELARSAKTFKLVGNSDLHLEKVDQNVGDYIGARKSHFNVLIKQFSMMVVFKMLVALGLLLIGGILVIDQRMNIGQFVAAEIIIMMVIASVEKLVLNLEIFYDVLTSLEKIGEVTDLPLDDDSITVENKNLFDNSMQVKLYNTTFTYPFHNKPTIYNISLLLEKGKKYMLDGENGSGKSTFLSLLAGFYDFNEGSIYYNGVLKENIETDQLKSKIGYCLTEDQLFNGSILENIVVGREQITDEDIEWALKNIGLYEYINILPKGINFILDPLGHKLPKSIVRKILLCRSIVAKPSLLLIENSFDILEEKERNRIIDFLCSDENKWTMVAISNIDYFYVKSDYLISLEDGKFVGLKEFKNK